MERISFGNTVFEGNNNAYLVSRNPTVIVDTGVATAETREKLRKGLAERDLTFADIDYILLTHHHADHSGLAGEIQAAGDAVIHAHELEASLIEKDESVWDAVVKRHRRRFTEWGMPAQKQEGVLSLIEGDRERYGAPADVTPIEDGEILEFGDIRLKAIHTPGHAAGHLCYETGDEIFSGDALLPQYTPNVGGADVRVDHPLARYLETLELIRSGGYARAWPGHRDPIDDPAARATAIHEHHEERSYRVLRVLSEDSPTDAWTVSAALFGELESIHVMHGPGEAYAHLEHLSREGTVLEEDHTYRLAPGVVEQLETIDDGRWPLEVQHTPPRST